MKRPNANPVPASPPPATPALAVVEPRAATTLVATVITFAVVATSALLFCSKGVFVKSAYRHGVDPLTLLTLRMLFAAPIFLIAVWITERSANARMPWSTVSKLIGLGFLGYYLSSIVNFIGLQYISVGLERMVLYTYPTLVVIGSVLFLKTTLKPAVIGATVLTYAGIAIAWHGEVRAAGTPGETLLGIALVFLSALTYAAFVLLSGRMIRDIGAIRFTACVVAISAGFVTVHFLCLHPASALWKVPAPVLGHAVILAVFGTALPAFLLGIGLARAGAQKFAVISTVGPVGTVILAWLVLGEALNPAGVAGFAMTMAGGVAVTLMKE